MHLGVHLYVVGMDLWALPNYWVYGCYTWLYKGWASMQELSS